MKRFKLILTILCFVQLQANSQSTPSEKKVFKNQIKFDLIAPLLEHLTFSYETPIANSRSLQLSIGIIGSGFTHEKMEYRVAPNQYEKIARIKTGLSGNTGIRFYQPFKAKSKDEIFLSGFYVEPNLMVGSYFSRKRVYQSDQGVDNLETERTNYGAALINLGYQNNLIGRISFDIFAGFGVGVDNEEFVEDSFLYFGEFHRGLYKVNGETSLAMKAGLKLGYSF